MKMLKKILPVLAGIIAGSGAVCIFSVYKNTHTVYGIYADPLVYEKCAAVPLPDRFVLVKSPDGRVGDSLVPVALRIDVQHMTAASGAAVRLPQDSTRVRYTLGEEPLFPVLQRDDTGRQGLSFYDGASMPEGTNALPVDWLYAGDESYPAVSVTYAECTFCIPLEPELQLSAAEWLNAVFAFSSAAAPRPETVFIAAVGDVMAGRGVESLLLADGGVEKVFTNTLPVLRSNDILIGNLEGAVTGVNAKAVKTYTFKFNKKIIPALQSAGFNYFMITNNHSFDYGLQGFKDTLAALAEYGAATSGAGYNQEEAQLFYHTTVRGLPVAVLSCGAYPAERSGFNGKRDAAATADRPGILWQSDSIFGLVRAEKEKGYFVIVNVHGGEEYVFKPSAAQTAFYKGLCDAGADAVFGSHPHVLQPVEWYGNKLIAYSLGNFVFPGMEGMRGGTDSLIVRLGVYNGRIMYKEEYQAKLNGTSVSLK